jgi:hypothetical protein
MRLIVAAHENKLWNVGVIYKNAESTPDAERILNSIRIDPQGNR